MARKTITVTIDAAGRDNGKVFIIREMSATQGEKWAARAFIALARSGIEIPEEVAAAGMAGIATLGISGIASIFMRSIGGMTFQEIEPLMDEMFSCIKIIPDTSRPEVVRGLIEDDVEELSTRFRLRKEVFKLHVDF